MIRISSTLDATPLDTTRRWMRESNARHVGADHQRVVLLAHDDDDLVGSLHGEIDWLKLHVLNLVVREDARGRGIGTRLMQAAEEIAAERGCTGAFLDTMSFQAPGFYRRLGYADVGAIEGFASGAAKLFLHKPIAPSAAG